MLKQHQNQRILLFRMNDNESDVPPTQNFTIILNTRHPEGCLVIAGAEPEPATFGFDTAAHRCCSSVGMKMK